jgi:hypothetical protein
LDGSADPAGYRIAAVCASLFRGSLWGCIDHRRTPSVDQEDVRGTSTRGKFGEAK